ncbi:hypothetical protein [Megalodesulfovibrio paquesii]
MQFDMEALLRASDEALYRVNAAGRDGYALYSDPTPTVAEPCHCVM